MLKYRQFLNGCGCTVDRAIFKVIAATYAVMFVIYFFMPDWVMELHWQPTPNIHVHHYFYGIIILASIGFIALVYPGLTNRLIAAIYGLGLFLVMDEANMWFKFREDNPGRYRYIGSILVALAFFAVYALDRIKKSR